MRSRRTTCAPVRSRWRAPCRTSRRAWCSRSSTRASARIGAPSPSKWLGVKACSSAPTTDCWPRRSPSPAARERCVELTNTAFHLDGGGRHVRRPRHLRSGRRVTCAPASTSTSSASASTRSRCCRACCRSHARKTARCVAEVLWVDRYGNVQLNVDADELDAVRRPGAHRLSDKTRGRAPRRRLRRGHAR